MKREFELAKNTIVIAIGTLLPKMAVLVTLPILTERLTKSEMGTYDLITTIVALVIPVITIQIQTAAFRFLIDCKNDQDINRIISTMIWFVGMISIVSIIIFWNILNGFDIKLKILISLYFIVDVFLNALQQIARGMHMNKLYSASAMIVSIVNMILILLLIRVINLGLYGVLLSIALATLVAMLYMGIRLEIYKFIKLRYFSFSTLKEMLSYSWPMVPNTLSNWVINLSDRMIITLMIGVEANAIYSVANKIPNLFTSIQNTFVLAWQENASIASKDDDIDQYYSRMFDSVSRIYFGVMSMLIAFLPIIFNILIKGDYNEAYYQMPILCCALLFSAVASFLGGIYVAIKQTKSVGITTIIAAMINLITHIILVKQIGIFAGSISTLLSYFSLAIFRMSDIRKYVCICYNKYRIFIMCIIIVVISVLCYQRSIICDIVSIIISLITSVYYNKKIILSFIKFRNKT